MSLLRLFFHPAVVLMKRLGYTMKFVSLWLTSLVAVAVVVANLYASLDKEIRSSQRELEGIALATPISRTVQVVQQHRGLSSAVLGGNAQMTGTRAAKEQEVIAAFAALARRLPANLTASEDWHSIRAHWLQLQQEGLAWKRDENFAAHTRLIYQLLLFKVTVSGEYVLPLDPQIDTSYLIDATLNRLPLALEHLGQIRAHGTVILTNRRAGEPDKVRMNTLIAQLRDEIGVLKINLDKVGRYNPALQAALAATSGDVADQAQRIAGLVEAEIVAGRFAASPEAFFAMTTEAIDRGYGQMYEALLPAIEGLIKERIAEARSVIRFSIGVAIALFLAAVYLSIGIYYATFGSIQALTRSAHAFAGGDLSARVALGGHDELKQVGDSFNDMADEVGALLAARQQDAARLSAIIETAMDAVVQMNAEGIVTGWNEQAVKMFGWQREEVLGRRLHETIIPARYRDAHVSGMNRFLASGAGPALNTRIEVAALHRDGHEFPAELTVTAIETAGQYEFNGFIRDITGRKQAEDLIWRQANFDPLTGLPNRRMFHDRVDQEIRKAARSASGMALLFIDLDRFKDVNDTLGLRMGDLLLVEAARRIGSCVRGVDTVARLGGDEFVVLLTELDNPSSIERVAEAILAQLSDAFRLDGEVAYVSASIGIALYPTDATEIESLLRHADQAMYVAKQLGRNRVSYFTAALQEAAQVRRQLINDLHRALADGEFRLYYQPIVDLVTGRIDKAEALIRWQHPTRGLVGPGEFVPLAEDTGLISPIGEWVFEEAARQAKRWRASRDPEFRISVNASPAQFREPNRPCQSWTAFLHELGLPGEGVVIEITEGLLLEGEAGVNASLRKFHESGMQVSLDDFGTGYSSLSYLKKFDIDFLKIDQSFTRNLAPGSSDIALCEAIIVMAHKLGLRVIAEGVETEAQRSLLAEAECDYAQGYLFSRPVPAEEFEALPLVWRPA